MTTFATYKDLPVSKKIVLLEIDLPIDPYDLISKEAGIWQMTITPETLQFEDDNGNIFYYNNQNTLDYSQVNSLTVDDTGFIKVNSLSELRVQTEGFFYDKANKILYICFAEYDWPLSKVLTLGVLYGFCDKTDSTNGAYFDGIYFEPRLLSVPGINKSKDPLFFGVQKFVGGNATLINKDGYFDNFIDADVYRQAARVKLGFDGLDYDEYRTVYTGFVDKYSYNFNSFIVKLQDKRAQLTRNVPTEVLTLSDYPTISDDNKNKPKPLIYGSVRNIPLLCLNGKAVAPANYTFFIADTTYNSLTAVSSIYVDGEEIDSAHYTVDLSEGTVEIAEAQVSGYLDLITADVSQTSIQNGIAVIKDLMANYGNVQFIPSNYNTVEMNIAQSTARDVGIYIDEQTELIKIIEEVCKSADIYFFPQYDGKYSARIYDSDRTPDRTITFDEWLGEPKVDIDESEFLSSVRIQYNKDFYKDKFREYINTDYEAEVLRRYGGYNQKTFKVSLSSESAASEKSEKIMELSKEIFPVVARSTKTQNIDLEIMDIVIGDPKARYGATEVLAKYEVIGIKANLTNAEVDLTLRFIETYIEPAETVYIQGLLWGHRIYLNQPFGVTDYE